jgi:peptide-methionine (S)-S-oxide reductase
MSMAIQTIVLAGGCFWGVEELFRTFKGVIETEVGYTGGQVENPVYEIVKTGTTGHAESIQIKFDQNKVSLDELYDFFFRLHDPTTLNQQGNDKGTQYRSAIFYQSEEQKIKAEEAIKRAQASGRWKKPIVTQVVAFDKFFSAEGYHQDYLQKNPNGYTCHWVRE